ncbi:MAG: SPOR domain-containing protein [Cyanobacteria bacterium REEB65]|nr:SPOR domain-containing protein [Cyanobacteria bacterium REEB65]
MAQKQPSPRPRPPRKRSSLPGVLYWSVFIICAGVSFGAGFWFTFRYTSQVNVRGPAQLAAEPAPVDLATPVPMVTPQLVATPQDLFAGQPTLTPAPLVTLTPAPAQTPPPEENTLQPTGSPPVGDLDSSDVSTPEPTPAEDVYRVQVGSYDTQEAAESMVQDLLAAGIQAVVVFDQTKYHAQVGAYSSKDRALEVADEVNAKGYAVTIRH